ncbi:fumarylacetoacetate hydrolase family protein [Planctomicrobium sp. SH661]|uniref:fumarylacetoacetate hydrolase family protein n=1 Tax=Planctomicrobium sp. SH661 TaxID=3448124 RepID=UPI003F5C8F66
MRLCRFQDQDQTAFGFYVNDEVVLALQSVEQALGREPLQVCTLLDLLPGGRLHSELQEVERQLTPELISELSRPVSDVKLLTPLAAPGKFLLLAGNYPLHILEGGGQAEERKNTIPYLFMKPPSTFTHPGDPVCIPACSPDQIDWELELGVVIGRTCSQVSEAEALDYVAGYTIVNDISDRSYRPNPQRVQRPRDTFFDWLHGKWHDTFAPWGPCLLPAGECPDPQQLRMVLKVNERVEQDGTTAGMVFPVAAVIEFISRFVTLQPGDLIATGTPDGVGKAKGRFLKRGDRMRGTIESIGTLENPVK